MGEMITGRINPDGLIYSESEIGEYSKGRAWAQTEKSSGHHSGTQT